MSGSDNVDPMQEWEELEARVNAIDHDELLWLEGFIMGLIFVQAHYDSKEHGMRTIETHLPAEWWHPHKKEWIRFDEAELEQKISDILSYADLDAGITVWRFKNEKTVFTTPLDDEEDGEVETTEFTYRVIEIGGTEGEFGPPEW